MKRFLRDYFTFNRRERRGVLFLLMMIALLLIYLSVSTYCYKEKKYDFTKFENEITEFEKSQKQTADSLDEIKYSYSQSQVKINLEKNKEGVLLKIEDHGIGIPQKFQSHIFEKFYRAPNATSKETDGTGLGLYIAKMLIEAHKGKIWFTSKEKKTTIFEIYLPFSKNRKK